MPFWFIHAHSAHPGFALVPTLYFDPRGILVGTKHGAILWLNGALLNVFIMIPVVWRSSGIRRSARRMRAQTPRQPGDTSGVNRRQLWLTGER